MPETATAPATSTALETVESFIAALERLDIDEALTYVDPDIVYQNVPFPPTRGVEATRRLLKGMLRFGTGFEVRMHNVAVNGDVVLTERTDVLEAGRFAPEFWVCGTFEVRDGKIVLWRDRFDFADITFATLRALVRAPFRR